MNKGILTKILATMLVLTMTLANIALLGTKSFALNTSLESQDTKTNNANVHFDAYFKDEEGNKVHTTTTDINSQTLIYFYINVAEGYLKDTNIQIKNPNFTLIPDTVSYDEIEKIDISSNTITLNKIRKGEQVELAIPIKSTKSEEISVDMFNKETEISINGLLVKDNSKTTKISKDIKVRAQWKGTAEINIEQGVIKYIAYEEDKTIILQTKIKTNIINSNLPIEKTSIKTIIPTINGISPEKIYVTSDSTKATNGNDGTKFDQTNWKKQDNTIIIEVANTVNNNKIIWKKDCVDEYIITYVYNEETFNSVKETNAKISLQTEANITAYNLETTKITKEDKKEGTLTEQVNNIVMFNVTTQETINKGYMYTGYETEYKEELTIDIAKEQVNTEITINQNTYITNQKEITANTEYKATKINKENFKQLLGQEGYINIYNQNNEKIATINKESNTDENNNYIVNYDTKVTSIKIETSQAKTVGKLKIENQKVILSDHTKEETKTFETIKTTIVGVAKYNEKEITKAEETAQLTLIEPQTQTQTIINNNTLSTIVENENVEIRTILKSSDISCKLFSNPIIKIQLPEYIENVSFNEAVKILFTNELEIETGTYNPETKTLEIKLKGEQTIFNDVSIAEGPTLVVNANITLNKLTPSKTDEIITTVTNGEETTETKTAINYIAPVGMVTVNTISGYNGNSEEASSVSGQETTGKIETNSNAKTAVVKITLINNNNNVCKNIEILGRTPFEGNKTIVTEEELGSTFTATLASRILATEGIDNSKITVYYSANENATKDLKNEENGWTSEPQNLEEIKSYLIVLNDYEMETGTITSFEYNTNIPEGLRNDEKTFGTFIVYYDNVISKEENVGEIINQPQQNEQPTQDNQNPEQNTTIPENNTNSNTIIENTTETTNNNTLQNNTTTENNTTTTPSNNNSTINEVLIPDQTQATVVGVATEQLPDVKVTLETDLESNTFILEGQVINYTATVVNIGKDTLKDVTLKIPVPDGTTARKFVEGTTYSKDEIIETDDTEAGIIIPILEPNKSATVKLQVIVKETKENNSIQAKAILSIDGYNNIESETINSNIITGILNVDMFTYLNANRVYKPGEEVQYKAYVQNIKESTDARNVKITCKIPEELEYVSAEYSDSYDNDYNKVTYNKETNTVIWEISKIVAHAQKGLLLNCKIKEGITSFTNQLSVECAQCTQTTYSNKVTRYVEKEKLEVTHTTDVSNEYVDVGDKINYYINVTNTGTAQAKNITVLDTLPTNLTNVLLSYKTNSIEKENISSKNGTIKLSGITLEPQETLKITVNVTVDELPQNAKGTITLTNKVTVNADNLEEIKPNDITHKIKVKEQPKDDEDKKYEISGIAWLDKSRDGIRDDNEELLKNIEVTLITKEEAKVVKTTKTDKKGSYIFKDIEKGEYLVVFAFDTSKYEITKYQVTDANEGKNSDAALQQTTFLSNGKTIEGATTNTIKVENANIYNIDIGLLESMKFDLSLTKTITKITKQNDEGIKTYDYTGKEKTLAKVEIPSKQVNKTNIIIEYTIKVTNEGNIPGYAKQIVDYLPSDLKFSSELNKEWYKSTDGNLYTKSLADTIINPGETKEIKLIVTKTTNEKNLGTTNNSAEIAESYNDYGIQDIDSKEGNKVTKEDDYGSADILISLNTGTIVIYISLITSMIAIIGVGAYMIKKKVLGNI